MRRPQPSETAWLLRVAGMLQLRGLLMPAAAAGMGCSPGCGVGARRPRRRRRPPPTLTVGFRRPPTPLLPCRHRFFDPGLGSRGLRRMQRRPRASFQFVEEGKLQKQAEMGRLRVRRVPMRLAGFGGCLWRGPGCSSRQGWGGNAWWPVPRYAPELPRWRYAHHTPARNHTHSHPSTPGQVWRQCGQAACLSSHSPSTPLPPTTIS